MPEDITHTMGQPRPLNGQTVRQCTAMHDGVPCTYRERWAGRWEAINR